MAVSKLKLPRYCICGARPVKLVETPDGGMDCLAYDWQTGELVRNMDYLDRVVLVDHPETDVVTEEEFEHAVAKLRKKLKKRP